MAKASMTGYDIKGFASAAIATALFIAYVAWTAPAVWMLIWNWSMRLMGERL